MCSASVGWHALSQTCPQSSLWAHGLRHPPSGALLKSVAFLALIIALGWFWQHKVKESEKWPFSFASWIILRHNELFSSIKSKSPMMYNPCFALDKDTHIRFSILKNPIFSSSLLRTRDNKMISFSSPWKLSTAVTLTPSYKSFGIKFLNWMTWPT